MPLSKNELYSFDKNGFLIIKNFWKDEFLKDLEYDLQKLGKNIIGDDFNLETFNANNCTAEQQSLFYDRLKYSPAFSRMSGSKVITSLCEELGLKHPHLMGSCNLRLDKPKGKHLFEWHQDTLYLLGSCNAVTIWFPIMGKVDMHNGTIQVIPGSHKNGVFPFKKISNKSIKPNVPFLQRDLKLDIKVEEEPVHITANKSDIVIFKQMLLHRSTQNFSEKIRWTGQIRMTDLGMDEYKKQGFPTGDKTNIFYVDYPGFIYKK